MLFALPLAAAGFIVAASPALHQAAAPAHSAAASALPLAGRWALDVSGIPAEERPRSVTISFRPDGAGRWATRVEIVAPDGARQMAEATGTVDGAAVPISGNFHGADTAALRQPAPNTLVLTLAKDGAPMSTRVYTVAKDRRTMTETIIWAGQDVPKLETTFRRVD